MSFVRQGKKDQKQFRLWPVLLLLAITLSGTEGVARATSINIPGILGLIVKAQPDFVAVFGASTDGANFAQSNLFAANAAVNGNQGTVSAAAGIVTPPIFGPAMAVTFAKTIAGPNQTSVASAFAKVGATISATAVIDDGNIPVIIDPFLVNQGTASATMAFDLFFNGQDLFKASATLNNGALTTSGAFSPSDFTVTVSPDGTTTAVLTHTDFSVPFSIPASLVNHDLTEEFDQSFSVSSSNLGVAIASSVPEPSYRLPLGVGLVLLAISTRVARRLKSA